MEIIYVSDWFLDLLENMLKVFLFVCYATWGPPGVCKVLLRGVGMLCAPGKYHFLPYIISRQANQGTPIGNPINSWGGIRPPRPPH